MGFLTPSPAPDASPTRRGLLSLAAQSIAGLKSFIDGVRVGGTIGPVSNEATDLGSAANRFGEVHAREVLADAVTFPGGASQLHAAPTLASGTGISVVESGGVATISATQLQKTLVGGQGIDVTEGANEFVVSHKLVGGNGITLADDAGTKETTISTPTVVLASAGSGVSIVEDGTGPSISVSSFMSSSAHRFALSKSASRLVIGLEDTGQLDCTYYGPYTYQRRTRLELPVPPGGYGPWSDWENYGTKQHAWVLRSSVPVWARRAGIFGYIMGLVSYNSDYSLPSNDAVTEYRWAAGNSPPDPIVVVGLPTAASPGVNWYSGAYNNWVPGNQAAVAHSLHLSSNQVRFMSGAALSSFSDGQWLAVCHHWMV